MNSVAIQHVLVWISDLLGID